MTTTTTTSTFTLDCCGLSELGRVRKRNEDQFLVAELQKSMLIGQTSLQPDESTRLFGRVQGRLLLVADGVGGAAAGDKASRIAVATLTRYILNTMPWFFGMDEEHRDGLKGELAAALQRCQKNITAFAADHPSTKGMGTTLTMAYVLWPQAYVVHVGDSRCYLYRGGKLEQVTTDHTMAQQLRKEGINVRPESRFSNMLWNVIGGGDPALVPEVYKVDLEVGDTLLLCTDGLNKHLPDKAIAELLGKATPAAETCRHAVDAANEAGGSDITAVVARFLPGAEDTVPAQLDSGAITPPEGVVAASR